ncbi:MAG: cytochrome c [Rhodocyclaceae bacterium]|nr:cytochrome c [Rhodocyclaceae bacterium]MBX3667299.1 cytochrome c [Rhodocyclaceae bacterium]
MSETNSDLQRAYSARARWMRRFWILFGLSVIVPVVVALALASRFLADVPVTYDKIEDHFKYGSTGGERASGFPYWIWRVLPQICPQYLPGPGYASLGMLYEEGKSEAQGGLPVGVSRRRNLGLDRVFFNCAVCHSNTVRERPDSAAKMYLGSPASGFNLGGFESFYTNCAADPKFSTAFIVPEIEAQAGKLSMLDHYIVYPVAIALMRERLLMLRDRFKFRDRQPDWGPGRVDTFSASKILFNFPMDKLPKEEWVGTADFPSIWNQGPRRKRADGQQMQLHWDGNQDHMEERNKNAAFGTGTLPPTIDLAAIGRVEAWITELRAPAYPFPVNEELAARGAPIYAEYCSACHGASGSDFSGDKVGFVTPIEAIGTDRARLDSFTYDLVGNLSTLYAGYPWRFQHFRKTYGYANMPLDGIWLRAPYLHNGSVPSLRDLLEPARKRPSRFYRGYDVFDQKNLGFVSNVADEKGRKFFLYDTSLSGNSNRGHEGKAYGTDLSDADKTALVEYLKKF